MADEGEIERAVAILRAGGLVAFPTETVYGLGADAANEDAVRRLFAAKGRPADHPVIVHLADAAQLPQWASTVPEAARLLAAAFWPGPLTLILPRAAGVLDVVTGGQDTVGVRVPNHPVAHALLEAFGGGVAAPSANRFGQISPTRAAHVRAEFDEATVPLVLDGDDPDIGVESTIVDVNGPRPTLLRPGGITPAQLAAVLGEPVAAPTARSPRVSGSLPRHYAPRTPLEIFSGGWAQGILKRQETSATKGLPNGETFVMVLRLDSSSSSHPAYEYEYRPPWHPTMDMGVGPVGWVWLTFAPADADHYAQWLYQILRDADALNASLILVEDVPDGEEWLAVRDRLRRAAQSS